MPKQRQKMIINVKQSKNIFLYSQSINFFLKIKKRFLFFTSNKIARKMILIVIKNIIPNIAVRSLLNLPLKFSARAYESTAVGTNIKYFLIV